MADDFTCSLCKGTFKKSRSDEEALAEKEKEWGSIPIEECDTLCSDCYQLFINWYNSNKGNA